MTRCDLSHEMARRALYIDFECLKGRPDPVPELLGILGGGEDDVRQVVLDPRLAPARVAKRGVTHDGVASAVAHVLEVAERDDRVIVGWSLFDRDVAVRAAPDLAERVKARYRNALDVARRWRTRLHPSVAMQKEDRWSPKHTLDKYARLAGYPAARALTGASPAGWIRHTLRQLDAKDGRYRAITPEAKRDWHRVLDYNRHDCLALRHILLKGTRELELWHAYERTEFSVVEDGRRVAFRVGSSSRKLQALLERHRATRFAFITAWNPSSQRLAPEENRQRGARLLKDVTSFGCRALPGVGTGDDPSWEPEESLMILGISRGKAQALGRTYGQLAIVFGERGTQPELVSCAAGTTQAGGRP